MAESRYRITVDSSFVISHLYAHKVAKCTQTGGGHRQSVPSINSELPPSGLLQSPRIMTLDQRERERKRVPLRTIYC